MKISKIYGRWWFLISSPGKGHYDLGVKAYVRSHGFQVMLSLILFFVVVQYVGKKPPKWMHNVRAQE